MELKRCSTCKQEQPLSNFYRNRSTKTGYANACKSCMKGYVSSWVQNNRERMRELQNNWDKKNRDKIHIKNKEWCASGRERAYRYGLSSDEYAIMLVEQNHSCAICGIDFNTLPKKHIHTDHCHETKVVRGILCKNCNVGLGFLKDNAENLQRAIEYLQRSRE